MVSFIGPVFGTGSLLIAPVGLLLSVKKEKSGGTCLAELS